MQRSLSNLILILSVFIVLLQGCNSTQSATTNDQIPVTTGQKVNTSPTAAPTIANINSSNAVSEIEDVGEITNCSPTRVYRGETFTVSMKTPHGIYSAIRRVKDNKWFFLYGDKNNVPVWNNNSFTKLPEITIDTETAYNSTNVDVGETPEKIFNKTGAYRVMVSHEDFGQDDPPWTGMCEIYYINKKRPNK